MRIGRYYRVLGIPAHVHQWPNITWSVEANSVQPWEPLCKPVNYLPLKLQNEMCLHTVKSQVLYFLIVIKDLPSFTTQLTGDCKVSARFQELWKGTASSPWRFSAIVAHCFGLDVAPQGLYDTLKLSLLLSLVQTRIDEKDTFHNLDLLVVTTDTLILDR